jgi:hypothetical protein
MSVVQVPSLTRAHEGKQPAPCGVGLYHTHESALSLDSVQANHEMGPQYLDSEARRKDSESPRSPWSNLDVDLASQKIHLAPTRLHPECRQRSVNDVCASRIDRTRRVCPDCDGTIL